MMLRRAARALSQAGKVPQGVPGQLHPNAVAVELPLTALAFLHLIPPALFLAFVAGCLLTDLRLLKYARRGFFALLGPQVS